MTKVLNEVLAANARYADDFGDKSELPIPGLIKTLETEAGIEPPPAKASATLTGDLIRRANVAVRKIKRGAEGTFIKATRTATFDRDQPDRIPQQTELLGSIWWPLVLTTNYDNFYEAAFAKLSCRE